MRTLCSSFNRIRNCRQCMFTARIPNENQLQKFWTEYHITRYTEWLSRNCCSSMSHDTIPFRSCWPLAPCFWRVGTALVVALNWIKCCYEISWFFLVGTCFDSVWWVTLRIKLEDCIGYGWNSSEKHTTVLVLAIIYQAYWSVSLVK